MKNSRNSFFALLNAGTDEVFIPGNDFLYRDNPKRMKNHTDNAADNEWLQEYRIIYNSYILEGSETDEIRD